MESAVSRIIALASVKGGAGKTTVTEALVCKLASECRIAVIDADPELFYTKWSEKFFSPTATYTLYTETNEAALAHLIFKVAGECDLLLLDTPGAANRAASIAMTAADLVIVPVKTSEGDVSGAQRTVELVSGLAKAARREIPARVLINNFKAGTDVWAHAISEMERAGLPLLASRLHNRVAYEELSWSGQLPSPKSPAGREIAGLVGELREAGFIPAATLGRPRLAV
ncbi:chromosome partitioning protein [Belnapia rosea]|nr:chromosome partitioning protein [Belnapia rosea]